MNEDCARNARFEGYGIEGRKSIASCRTRMRKGGVKDCMIDAVVLGCWENGYGVIRQLRDARLRLRIAGTFTAKGEVWRYSRYLQERVKCPDPAKSEEAFMQFLLGKAGDWRGALLIPTSDHYLEALSRNKGTLERRYHYRVLADAYEKQSLFLDKSKTYKLARSIGIAVPDIFYPKSVKALQGIKGKLSYPCLLKPVEGHKFFAVYKHKMFKVKSFEELVEKFEDTLKKGMNMSIHLIVKGPDTHLLGHYAYVDRKGSILFDGTREKVRQNPPFFGVARVIRTTRNEEVERLGRKLLRKSKYKGFAGAEFKRDARDGKIKLIEVNSRPILANLMYWKGGVNIMRLAYLDRVKGVSEAFRKVRPGVYWMNVYEDFRNTFFVKSEEHVTFKEFIKPYLARDKVFGDLDFKDPLPFLLRLGYALGMKAKAIMKGMKARKKE